MTINRPNLGNAFSGPPDRSAGLSDLLPPVKSRAETKPQRAKTAEPAQAPESKPRQTPPVTASSPDDVISSVGVYLEPDVLTAVRAERRRGRVPGEPDRKYDELLVDALGKITLGTLITEFASPEQSTNSLLQPRQRRPRGTAGIQIQPRLSKQQTATLDHLVKDTGAPSRSALIATAFRLAYMSK